MTVQEYFSFLAKLVDSFPLTLLDLLILCSLFIYAAAERKRGIAKTSLTLLCIVITYLGTLLLYPTLTSFFRTITSSKGIADGVSLIVAAVILGLIALVVYGFALANISDEVKKKTVPAVEAIINIPIFLAVLTGIIVVFLSFPIEGFIKHFITDSRIASGLVKSTIKTDATFHQLLVRPVNDLLLFRTVDSQASETMSYSGSGDVKLDTSEANLLLITLTANRNFHSESILSSSPALTQIANAVAVTLGNDRELSRTMFRKNSLFDLLDAAGISSSEATVLVARAPSASIALAGLMENSEYKNILLSNEFTTVASSVVSVGNESNLYVLIFSR